MRTITLSQYQDALRSYEELYEAGLTVQPCDFCDQHVVEKVANYDFYSGSGVVLHEHCVGHWMRYFTARDWWMLGFGLITEGWYRGHEAENHDYMGQFAACLGYGRWA